MQVLSPVGRFPLRLTSVTFDEGTLKFGAEMGVWRSEVQVGREDLPLVAATLATLAGTFLMGLRFGRRR